MSFSERERFELAALVGQAWELKERGSPYFGDACQAIIDWHDRCHLRRFEREHEEAARVVRLLRETRAA